MKRVSKKKRGAPEWMTTFADLMALMLTFFVLLLSMAKTDSKKYEQALISIQDSFGKPWHGRLSGTASVIGEQGTAAQHITIDAPVSAAPSVASATTDEPEQDQGQGQEQDDPLFSAIATALEQDIKEDHVELIKDDGEIIVRFPEHISFATASAELQDEFIPILNRVAGVLEQSSRHLVVVGHTDNRPISTVRFRSNWDLSSARASTVVHYLLSHTRIAAEQIVAQGRADSIPLVENDTFENRATNRRVEIVITSIP